jgi:shikimate kinase
MNVALVGYRGCGKSTVGKRLADRLWIKYADVDENICKKSGKTIKAMFEEDGEPYFRAIETEVVKELTGVQEQVISLGGGTVIKEENRKIVRDWATKIIYMRCSPEVLEKRILLDTKSALTRPALTQFGGGIEEIKLKLTEREPLYRSMMDAELDVTNLTPDEAVVYIARML